jgi:hypothetical protein
MESAMALNDANNVAEGVEGVTRTSARMGAEDLETIGEGIEYAGLLTGQPEIAAVGAIVGGVGSAVIAGMDLDEGKRSTTEVAVDYSIEITFDRMGK